MEQISSTSNSRSKNKKMPRPPRHPKHPPVEEPPSRGQQEIKDPPVPITRPEPEKIELGTFDLKYAQHARVWSGFSSFPDFSPLNESITTDVLIVGGGITGLTTALNLKRLGKKVVLVTRDSIGGGSTGYSSGHLTQIPDAMLSDLIRKHGCDAASKLLQKLETAINFIEQVSRQFPESSEFSRVPAFRFSDSATDLENLKEETQTARELGLQASCTRFVEGLPVVGALKIENQARINPLRYLQGLSLLVEGEGCRIFSHTDVTHIQDAAQPFVLANGKKIHSHKIVLATHSPIGRHLTLQTQVSAYQTYLVAAQLSHPFPEGIYWDTSDPYYYLRRYSAEKPSLLIAGGRDHRTGKKNGKNNPVSELIQYLTRRYEVKKISHYWSGEIYESVDELPFVGKIPWSQNLYSATGYAGVGLSFGTLAGLILADLVSGKANDGLPLLKSKRPAPLNGARRFLKSNAETASRFIFDRFSVARTENLQNLKIGEGNVVRHCGRKMAVSRDEHKGVIALSPYCTHLRGIAQWNPIEKTWDCPLHGGRYASDGTILEGPPLKPLAPFQKGSHA